MMVNMTATTEFQKPHFKPSMKKQFLLSFTEQLCIIGLRVNFLFRNKDYFIQ